MANGKAEQIRRLNPPELGTPPGYPQIVGVRASCTIFIAGQTSLNRDGELVWELTILLHEPGRFSKT